MTEENIQNEEKTETTPRIEEDNNLNNIGGGFTITLIMTYIFIQYVAVALVEKPSSIYASERALAEYAATIFKFESFASACLFLGIGIGLCTICFKLTAIYTVLKDNKNK